jgi:hypothetical protein
LRRLLAVLICAALLAAAVVLAIQLIADAGLEPVASAGASPSRKLPPGTVLLNASGAKKVAAPFESRRDAAAADGILLTVPRGNASPEGRGRASFALKPPRAGAYHAWARVLWMDSCGNSLYLKAGKERRREFGHDSVYGVWHWVSAGSFQLDAGRTDVEVGEREDGVALDQLLFTPDPDFHPAGQVLRGSEAAGIRRFADSFDRSPGHGTGAWELRSGKWGIAFSLDPNRIPNQYSLTGAPAAGGGEALALVEGAPWRGCRMSFSLRPTAAGRYGAVLEHGGKAGDALFVEVDLRGKSPRLLVSGAGGDAAADLGDALRLGQWHRLEIERWAWVLRVLLDGRAVLTRFDRRPGVGRPGLVVRSGSAVFDDVRVESIPWEAEDGGKLRVPWVAEEGARWYRSPRRGKCALIGRRGELSVRSPGLPLGGLMLEEARGSAGNCKVEAPGLARISAVGDPQLFVPAAPGPPSSGPLRLGLSGGKVRLVRAALCYGRRAQDLYRIGPYHFGRAQILDPSDYYDLTPEERRQIRTSPEVDKLRRRKKFYPLVSADQNRSAWIRERGAWRVGGGVLTGSGPGARLRHWDEVLGDLEVRMRFRLKDKESSAGIELYAGPQRGARVRIVGASATPPPARPGEVVLRAPDDGDWHRLRVRTTGEGMAVRLDEQEPRSTKITRGDGGRFLLWVPAGTTQFDDVELLIPRKQPHGGLYAWDRPEAGWWREGGKWVDHEGIACALASNWISLVAPRGEGTLWLKRPCGPDVRVAFNLGENTQWFGWKANPSHIHHPFDNVRVQLVAGAKPGLGYRLELNSRGRTATVLYRNGKEVAAVPQAAGFPLRYVGGHAPYAPRRCRVTLSKRGGVLTAIVNGKEVLRYTDPRPLNVDRVGLGGFRTRANFSHVEVHEFKKPQMNE